MSASPPAASQLVDGHHARRCGRRDPARKYIAKSCSMNSCVVPVRARTGTARNREADRLKRGGPTMSQRLRPALAFAAAFPPMRISRTHATSSRRPLHHRMDRHARDAALARRDSPKVSPTVPKSKSDSRAVDAKVRSWPAGAVSRFRHRRRLAVLGEKKAAAVIYRNTGDLNPE